MLSGSILGAILRAIGIAKREKAKESYKDLAAIAGVWAMVMFVVSLLILLFGTTLIGTLDWLLPANIIELITTVISFGSAIWTALIIGISSFVSLFIGAGVIDIAYSIAKRV